ncbi:MAG TPA: hypothetical protein VF777_02015 [Phycisphaerales bacterium]
MTRDLRHAHRRAWLVLPIALIALLMVADATRRRAERAIRPVSVQEPSP